MTKIIEAVATENEMIEINDVISLERISHDGHEALKKYNEQVTKFIMSKDINNLIANVTEDNLKKVKEVRADIRREIADIETRRKTIEKAYNADLKNWKSVYTKLALAPLEAEDEKLRKAVVDLEDKLRANKTEEVKEIFNAQVKETGYDFITFEDLNLNVQLSTKMADLKTEIAERFELIKNDLKVISLGENKERTLAEYQKELSLTKAIINVANAVQAEDEIRRRAEVERQRAIELVMAGNRQAENQAEAVLNAQRDAEALKVGTKVKEDEQFKSVTFTVRATKPQLIALNNFLVSNLIDFK